jgi:hypothetical protein
VGCSAIGRRRRRSHWTCRHIYVYMCSYRSANNVLCYAYNYNMIFVISFLKPNINGLTPLTDYGYAPRTFSSSRTNRRLKTKLRHLL